MKVSIITATYNSGQTIRDALVSVGQQTHKDIEHIFVDGYSTDETLSEIYCHAIENCSVIQTSPEGIYHALNKGLENCSGDIVGILHSDDVFASSNVIAEIARKFANNPTLDLVYGDLIYVSHLDRTRVVRHWQAGSFDRRSLRNGWMPPHPTVFVSRRALPRYVFDASYKISGDYHALLRLLSDDRLRVGYIPETLVHMSTGGASNGTILKTLLRIREDWLVAKSSGFSPLRIIFLKSLRKVFQFSVWRGK